MTVPMRYSLHVTALLYMYRCFCSAPQCPLLLWHPVAARNGSFTATPAASATDLVVCNRVWWGGVPIRVDLDHACMLATAAERMAEAAGDR